VKPETTTPSARPRRLRFPAFLAALILCAAGIGAGRLIARPLPAPGAADKHGPDAPVYTLDEDCQVFQFSYDDRVACGAHRLMRKKKFELERDDVWIASKDGKKKRIIDGEKYLVATADTPFSYLIKGFTWSPDGRRLAIEISTAASEEETDAPHSGEAIALVTDEGREIPIPGMKGSTIDGATQGAWLADNNTLAYLQAAESAQNEIALHTIRISDGKISSPFAGRMFSAVTWDPRHNAAVAITDTCLNSRICLVRLDLIKETIQELAPVREYFGQLTVSPSATKAAYFSDGQTLEIRPFGAGTHTQRITAAAGEYQWDRSETRILLKRGAANRSGDIMWVRFSDGDFEPILHDLYFHDFAISPDGEFLGVTQVGLRHLTVYPIH
jgi:WD40-like Beta Propeller Repeat